MFFWAAGGGSVTPGWGGNSQLHLGREDISDLVEKKPSIPSLKIPRLFGGLVATSCYSYYCLIFSMTFSILNKHLLNLLPNLWIVPPARPAGFVVSDWAHESDSPFKGSMIGKDGWQVMAGWVAMVPSRRYLPVKIGLIRRKNLPSTIFCWLKDRSWNCQNWTCQFRRGCWFRIKSEEPGFVRRVNSQQTSSTCLLRLRTFGFAKPP